MVNVKCISFLCCAVMVMCESTELQVEVDIVGPLNSYVDSLDNQASGAESDPKGLIAWLQNLRVSEGELQPVFNTRKFNYSMNVGANISQVHIIATLPEGKRFSKWTVKIESNALWDDIVIPGLLLRKEGETTTFQIHVSAHKHLPCTYYLYIARDREDNNANIRKKISWWEVIGYCLVAGVFLVVLGTAGVAIYYCSLSYLSGDLWTWWPFMDLRRGSENVYQAVLAPEPS